MTVFFSGCLHHCEGCHNPISHSFQNGRPFTKQIQDDLIEYIQATPFISGITLSGGDPMYSANAITAFVQRLRQECRSITVWVYSGFTYEEIVADPEKNALIELCDVLVDGPFVQSKKTYNLKYKGSTNQRTIDIQASRTAGCVVLLNDEVNSHDL